MGRKRKYASKEEEVQAKRERDAKRNASKVILGQQVDRWKALALDLGIDNEELAKLLIDRYMSAPVQQAELRTREVSVQTDIILDSESQPESECMDEVIDEFDDDDEEEGSELLEPDIIEGADDVDESYHPSDLSLKEYCHSQYTNEREYKLENLEDCSAEEMVHDIHTGPSDDTVDEKTFTVIKDSSSAMAEIPCIAYVSSLLSLAPELTCGKCNKPCTITVKHVGSAVVFLWNCENQHTVRQWSSQPRLHSRGLNLADYMTAVNILVSGNNYHKMALFFRFMGLRMVNQPAFSSIQRMYCLPVIDTFWGEVNAETLSHLKDKPIILAGDGRNDSPGFCAQYCTYTMMEHGTGHILALTTLDKRVTQGNSGAMEKEGLRRGILHLQKQGLSVQEIVTDAHMGISAMMRKEYSGITHQWDVWHGAKNLTKRLTAKADMKGNEALKEWIGDISNHFWYCASKANGDLRQFLGRWKGILHHTTGSHEWLDGTLTAPQCEHEPMTEPTAGKSWLKAGSPAHLALGQLVTDKRFLNTLPHYLNFRHTGELEVFHQHLLMYAGKRFAFSPPVYTARNQLAALDYHLHADRAYKTQPDGKVVHKRMYNKRTKHWFAVKVKVPKTYSYISDLQARIIQMRLDHPTPLAQRAVMAEDDPRQLSRTLAARNPPPLHELVAQQVSRMEK